MRRRERERRDARRAALVVVTALLLVVLPMGATAQESGEGGGDQGEDGEQEAASPGEGSSLSGYSLRAEGTPLGLLLFEPFVPLPVEPGDPQLELKAAYTSATFSTGPSGRALASSLWPGAGVGDGLGQLVQGVDYPIKVSAQVGQGDSEDSSELAPGAGMDVLADDTGTVADATTTELPSDVFGAGTFESHSESLVEEDEAVSRMRTAVSDVSLLGGLVQIDSVVTELEARGDGAQASTSGGTDVSGLTIAGTGYSLDEEGLQLEDGQGGQSLPLGLGASSPKDLREQLGIEVELLPHEQEAEGGTASRSAGGVRLSLDIASLRDAPVLGDVLGDVEEALPEAIRQPSMPDGVPVNPVDLPFLEPRVDLVLARGIVEAGTSEPAELDLGDFDDADADADAGEASQAPATAEGADLEAADPPSPSEPSTGESAGVDLEDEPVEEPQVSEGPSAEQDPSAQAMEPAGLPESPGTGLVTTALALAVAGLGARGLYGVTGRVFGVGGGAGCPDGHPTGVADLKQEG